MANCVTLYDGGDDNDGDAHGSHDGDDGVLQCSRKLIICFGLFSLN